MLIKIKQFFTENFILESKGEAVTEQQVQLVSAALFIEMMLQDCETHNAEKQIILDILQQQFSLGCEKSIELYQLAEDAAKAATDYYQFTNLIAQEFTQPQKIQLIENLWRVAFADMRLDKYEENMVRKIADLIHVSHKDFIQTKNRVQQSLA